MRGGELKRGLWTRRKGQRPVTDPVGLEHSAERDECAFSRAFFCDKAYTAAHRHRQATSACCEKNQQHFVAALSWRAPLGAGACSPSAETWRACLTSRSPGRSLIAARPCSNLDTEKHPRRCPASRRPPAVHVALARPSQHVSRARLHAAAPDRPAPACADPYDAASLMDGAVVRSKGTRSDGCSVPATPFRCARRAPQIFFPAARRRRTHR